MDDERQERANRNRTLAPEFAAFVDAIRRWAPGSIVVGVEGPGVSLGRVRAWGVDGSMSAAEWQRWVNTGELPAGKTSPWRRPEAT